jgi:hypothetical protein
MLNAKTIGGIILGIILLNNSLYTIIALPAIINIIAVIGAAVLLIMDSMKGGIIGKICLVFGIIIGIYALAAVLGFLGMPLTVLSFIFGLQRLAYIVGGILLIVSPFVNV